MSQKVGSHFFFSNLFVMILLLFLDPLDEKQNEEKQARLLSLFSQDNDEVRTIQKFKFGTNISFPARIVELTTAA